MKQDNTLQVFESPVPEPFSIKGTRNFMGHTIPIVEGGFGPDSKCISDKTVGEIHGMRVVEVRKTVIRNEDRFANGVDYVDVCRGGNDITTLQVLEEMGYAKQSVTQAEHIYIFSERGYLKLVKIFNTDEAWDVYQRLLDEYFRLRSDKEMPKDYPAALRALADEVEKRMLLEAENAQQKQIIAECEPKVSYYDIVLQTPDLLPISQIAKDYGKSAQWLNQKLHEKNVQFKQGKVWLLYQKHAKQGYTKSRTTTFIGKNGEKHSRLHTYWTQKGRLFIYDLLKQDGVLPLVETKLS